MAVTVALFVAGIVMGLAGACLCAWAVHSGQFRDLERTKEQLFWPDLAGPLPPGPVAPPAGTSPGPSKAGPSKEEVVP